MDTTDIKGEIVMKGMEQLSRDGHGNLTGMAEANTAIRETVTRLQEECGTELVIEALTEFAESRVLDMAFRHK